MCTNVGGNPELVHHGTSGLLVECGDVDAIARAIGTLLCDGRQAASLGAAARAMALRHCTRQAMLALHLSLYEAMSAGRRAARPA